MEVAPLLPGKIGLRCKHCQQQTSFPNNLSSVCAVSIAFDGIHFMKGCNEMDDESSKKLLDLKRSLGGRGGNYAKQHKGPYSAAEYVAKCLLQDLGMNQVPDRHGL
jgi:hypothetical protein